MTTWDLIIALFYHVDEQLHDLPKHPEAHIWPSEVVTLGLLHALKGVGNRAFHRWLTCDDRTLFPCLREHADAGELCRRRHLLHLHPNVHVRVPTLEQDAQVPVERLHARL
jgi:hypothetical protein